jgi:hypothetical protein
MPRKGKKLEHEPGKNEKGTIMSINIGKLTICYRMVDFIFNWKERQNVTVKELLEGDVMQDLLKSTYH